MPTHSPDDRRRSTEYFGQGQSGYTAGRVEDDRSLELELEPRNAAYPRGADDDHAHEHELATDERWSGLGRAPWAPEKHAGQGAEQNKP